MACIASTFTGSVAALKASKVQVRRATRARAISRASPAPEVDVELQILRGRRGASGAAPRPGRTPPAYRAPETISECTASTFSGPCPRLPPARRPRRRETGGGAGAFREFLRQLDSAIAHYVVTSGD